MLINQEESRTKNSIRNVFFAAILYISKLVMQFVVRAVFIRYFLVEYLGVNGLFTNVLSVLSLAELGIGNAIVYEMYAPVAKKDYEKLYSLVNLYKKLYMIIAGFITIIGLCIIPLLPYLIRDAGQIHLNLIIIYLMYLFQTVIGYIFAYRRSIIFAFQRNDIESIVSALVNVLMGISQIFIIVYTNNYYLYTIALIVFSVIEAVTLYMLSYKLLPKHNGKIAKLTGDDKKRIEKNVAALFCHKIGGAIVISTDSIIISSFIGTYLLGIYSNYSLIVTALGSFMVLFLNALRSSLGNMIAKKDVDEVFRLFNAMLLAYVFLVGAATVGVAVCFQDFIMLYTGNSSYVLPNSTVFLIVINYYFLYSKNLCGIFKEGSGLFWNDRYRALFEAGINLILDIVLVQHIGINGVIIATITSTLTTVFLIEPYVLFKHYFNKNILVYFSRYGMYSLFVVISYMISRLVCDLILGQNILIFVVKGIICIVITTIVFWGFNCRSSVFKDLISIFRNFRTC